MAALVPTTPAIPGIPSISGELDDGAPWTRAERAVFAVLIAGLCASLFHTVHPWYDEATDAALYVLTARSIAAGEGYTYFGVPFIIRPPGFSLLIAPFAAYPTNFLLLNTLVSLSGVACVALMFAFYRPRLGAAVTFGLCVSVWLNPIFQQLSTQVLSDVPGAALVFAALLLDRAARRRPTLARHALLGLCIAGGLYVRSVCTLLVPAVLLARLAQRLAARRSEGARAAWRTCWPVLAIPVLAWLPWSLRNARADVPAPPEHVFLHSYSAAIWREDPAFPDSRRLGAGEILARVPVRLGEMLPLLGQGYREDAAPPRGLAVALAAVTVACATAVLIRRRNPAEFLFGGVLIALAIYFAFKPRLALTLFLLGPPAVCEVALWLARPWPALTRASAWTLAVFLGVAPLLSFDRRAERYLIEIAASERRRLVAFLDRELQPDQPIALPTGWDIGVETDRRVYGLQITAQRVNMEAALAMIPRYGIAAAVVDPRSDLGKEFGRALSYAYPRYRTVGNWVVFCEP
jgi:hypothetical protein